MKNRTDEEVKQIALDLHRGKIFTDRHISDDDDGFKLERVFFVLGMLKPEQMDAIKADPPGLIFEYIEKAGPRGFGNLPMFFSMQMLSQEDTTKMFAIYNKLREAEESVLA